VIEQPLQLGSGKIGIDDEPGLASNELLMACASQCIAGVGGTTILPHDRVGDRPASRAVPQDGCLALIGDPDRRQIRGFDARLGNGLGDNARLRRPDFRRIVLHPPWLWIVLREFPLRDRAHRASVIEHDRAGAGRALVQGKHERHGVRLVVCCAGAA
jgi:hypothetical protein